jgi:hypothetical protein
MSDFARNPTLGQAIDAAFAQLQKENGRLRAAHAQVAEDANRAFVGGKPPVNSAPPLASPATGRYVIVNIDDRHQVQVRFTDDWTWARQDADNHLVVIIDTDEYRRYLGGQWAPCSVEDPDECIRNPLLQIRRPS